MKEKALKYVVVLNVIIVAIAIIIAIIYGINKYVIESIKNKILKVEEASKLEDIDCIVVLGAGIIGDRPSDMLRDRLKRAIELYNMNPSLKIIMSGDHGQENHDEVNVMKNYAIENGVKSEDIFMDHAGFSTYESMYRAKEVFDAKKVIVITQEYHLYRALYIANKLGLDAYGVDADLMKYRNQNYREFREILAINKDFFKCIVKPKPKFLGEKIPVTTSNGDITNDKENKLENKVENKVENKIEESIENKENI